MTIRVVSQSFAAATAVLVLAACGGAGGGLAPQPGAGAQSDAYVPQSAGAPAAATAEFSGKSPAIVAFPQPLPEALIALGHGASPDITAPIINDTGAYTNGPIILGSNTTNGFGVEGATYGRGAGVYGRAATSTSVNAFGVYGTSANGAGIYGYASKTGAGVLGSSVGGYGVEGVTADGSTYGGYFGNTGGGDALEGVSTGGIGAYGNSQSYIGVFGSSQNSVGVYANSTNNIPLEAVTAGSERAFYASSNANTAVDAHSTSGTGVSAITGGNGGGGALALFGSNANGNAAEVRGTYIGIVARTPAGGFPLIATDPTGATNLFYVDGAGNVSYKGGLFKFLATKTRGQAVAYGATTATPTIEDTGTAQLVNGSATVPFDSTFAETIDGQRTYQVMLTPDGDTRGLYVANKTATGFVVREVQGGRGSFAFDYHIYATTLGHARERMALVSGSGPGIPHAPASNANLTRPALPSKPH